MISDPPNPPPAARLEGPVVAVPTHRNLRGLRHLVPLLLEQTVSLDLELVIVDNASDDGTREWLAGVQDGLTVLRLPLNEGPAAAFNAVFQWRPLAEAYLFFGDDTLPEGGEVARLLDALRSNDRLGIVGGVATAPGGDALTTTYTRRPLERAFPRLWTEWWGENPGRAGGTLEYVDVVSGSGMAIRGDLSREIGPFETLLWPVAFEDLDYCARARFRGWHVAVDHAIPIRQEVSTTTTKVFGSEYAAIRRSTGLLYAAMNYPILIAAGRVLEAWINALTSPTYRTRQGDARGLLRCARAWRPLLQGRRMRRRLRRVRRTTPS